MHRAGASQAPCRWWLRRRSHRCAGALSQIPAWPAPRRPRAV